MENKKERLWSRYWAEQGLAVIHIDKLTLTKDISELEEYIMRVDKVLREPKKDKDDNRMIIQGIKCRWFTKSNELQAAKFHTKELIPWDILKEGGLTGAQKWIERELND